MTPRGSASDGDRADGASGGEPCPGGVPAGAATVADPPKVLDRWVRFRVADPDRRYAARHPASATRWSPAPAGRSAAAAGGWELRIPRPSLARLEYQLGVVDHHGQASSQVDPANPRRVDTAFGQKSVVELPGYEPALVADRARGGRRLRAPWSSRGETTDALPVTVWSPEGTARAGPVAAAARPGRTRVRRARVADPLLRRPDRRRQAPAPPRRAARSRCSATRGTPARRSTCARRWAPASPGCAATTRRRPGRGLGASLGGLTALLAGLRAAGEVGAVFSQSGSFFQVGPRRPARVGRRPSPTTGGSSSGSRRSSTSGTPTQPAADRPDLWALEENAPNNASMAAALAPGRAPGRPTSRCRTCTTTPPGATRWTRISPMSCEIAGVRQDEAVQGAPRRAARCPGRTTVSA